MCCGDTSKYVAENDKQNPREKHVHEPVLALRWLLDYLIASRPGTAAAHQ